MVHFRSPLTLYMAMPVASDSKMEALEAVALVILSRFRAVPVTFLASPTCKTRRNTTISWFLDKYHCTSNRLYPCPIFNSLSYHHYFTKGDFQKKICLQSTTCKKKKKAIPQCTWEETPYQHRVEAVGEWVNVVNLATLKVKGHHSCGSNLHGRVEQVSGVLIGAVHWGAENVIVLAGRILAHKVHQAEKTRLGLLSYLPHQQLGYVAKWSKNCP